LATVNQAIVFTRDTLFKTPSGAADIVLFTSTNGWQEWKTDTGMTLAEATGRGVETVEDDK
jgi:hypothetical protein